MNNTQNTPATEGRAPVPCSACRCDTPKTHALLNLIFDRDSELCERNAPERWVKLARKLERENLKLRALCERALKYGLNGSDCYDASEACDVGEEMRAFVKPNNQALPPTAGGANQP